MINFIRRAWYQRVLRQLRTQQQFATRDPLTSEAMREYTADRISDTELRCRDAGMAPAQIAEVVDYEPMPYAMYGWMLLGMACAMALFLWWVTR